MANLKRQCDKCNAWVDSAFEHECKPGVVYCRVCGLRLTGSYETDLAHFCNAHAQAEVNPSALDPAGQTDSGLDEFEDLAEQYAGALREAAEFEEKREQYRAQFKGAYARMVEAERRADQLAEKLKENLERRLTL